MEEIITENPNVKKQEGMSDKKDDSNSKQLSKESSTKKGDPGLAIKSSSFFAVRWYMMVFD